MTDNTQPESLRLASDITASGQFTNLFTLDAAAAELRRQHARIAELEARVQELGAMARENRSRRIVELEARLDAIRAGGVSGPLMGQPQAMPDISALTERGAKAWAGVDAQELRGGGADISREREDFNAWLRTYEEEVGAIDEAAAWAGFSGARASLAASAGSEPVAWTTGLNWRTDTRCQSEMVVKLTRKSQPEYGFTQPLYTHPSSPEGTVGVWQDIATAPKDGTRILLHPAIEVADAWSKGHWNDENKCWIVGGSPSGIAHTSWAPLPPAPPTTSAGSGKGE